MKFVKFKNSLIVKTNNSYVFLKVNNTDDGKEVEWITVKGNHIPVKKGQSKEEAVKSFIESKKGREKGESPYGIKFKEFVDKAGKKSMRALIERNGGKVEAKKEDGFVSGKIYAPEGKKIRGTKEDVFASFEVREEDFEDFVNKRLGKDSKYFEEVDKGSATEKSSEPKSFEDYYKEFKEREEKTDWTGKTVKVPLIRKPSNMDEIERESRKYVGGHKVKIEETIELSEDEYKDLINNPLKDRDYLKGKGGFVDGWDSPRKGILIKCKGRRSLVVDPQGYSYARYIGLF